MGGHAEPECIVGREAELARLRGALDDARRGRPAVVVITGPPGVGKTSLWRTVLAAAGDPIAIVATGDEAEIDLDHGVVDQLVRRAPIADDLRRGAEPGPADDPVRVGSSLLGVVDRVTYDRPLAVVVDDAQWADEASLRALTFAARRLRDDRILLCVTCRTDEQDRLPTGMVRLAEDGGRLIRLGPLDADAVGELATRAYGRPVPPAAVTRLHQHTGGNPLHTRALLDELPFEALTSDDASTLPVPRTYGSLVLGQVAGCGDAARSLVATLAVLGAPAPLGVAADAAGCPDPLAAVDELVGRGLVELHRASNGAGPTLAFPHGLVRAAILGDLSPSRRAELHAAAAAVTEGDEALGHRLAAAVGPDAGLVAAARARAAEQVAAGAPAVAARHLLAAAPLAAAPGEREQLVALAAAYLALAGRLDDALVGDVAGFPPSALRSFVLGRSAVVAGDTAAAQGLLVDAWERAIAERPDGDVRVIAGPVADLLAILALHRGDGEAVTAWGRRAVAAGSRSGASAALGCHGLAIRGRFAEAEAEMTALLEGDPDPVLRRDALFGRGVVRLWANDVEGAAVDLAGIDDHAGRPSTLATVEVRSYRAEAAYRLGRWAEALDLAESAASIADDAGDPMVVALPHSVAAFVLAGRGDLDAARAHLDVARANAEATGLVPARLWTAHAAMRVASAAGDHAEVVRLGDAVVADGFDRHPEGIHHWRATYVEALVAVGRHDDAVAVAGALDDLAAGGDDISVAADAARAGGLVASVRGRRDAATRRFEAGLALDPERSRPFERARLELAAGAHLRRAGDRRAAAALLEQAAERFAALGAHPWSAQGAREIEACGLTPRRRSAHRRGDGLTAQERLVARLAAGGRTNREVASELVISVKTVEHHLGRVYAKLGVRSRTEMAARLLAGDDGVPGPRGTSSP